MWNNIPPANANMNKFERLMDYKGHLERLAQATKVINTKKPKVPSFFNKRVKSPSEKEDKNLKIYYENRLLFYKLYDIRTKYSPYSACLNIPSKCPAYELLSYHRLKKDKIIYRENNKLYKRFAFIKPTLHLDKYEKDYQYKLYLESNISQNKNRKNPNLDFVEFESFNKRIKGRPIHKILKSKKLQRAYSTNNSLENSKISKDIIMPNLTMNYKRNNRIKFFNRTEMENNINDIYLYEKIKKKRPNSCKPNIIVIKREIQDESNAFSSDNIFSSSRKNKRNKPISCKTRSNGSYSTNMITSS